MRYLLVIGGTESSLNGLPEPHTSERHPAWADYTRALATANKLRGGERLQPSSSATIVRQNAGQPF